MLQFMNELNAGNLHLITKVKDYLEIDYFELFSEEFLFFKCILNVISAIEYCHLNSLSFGKELDFKNVVYSVREIESFFV